MSSIEASRMIDAPLSRVFETVSDIRNFSKAVPDIVNVEFLTDQTKGKGTRFRESREINGKEASTVLEVIEYAENERIRLVADSHGTVWDSAFTVRDADGKTELKLVMEAKAYKLSARLMNVVMKGFVRKALEKDMDAVKLYCETNRKAES